MNKHISTSTLITFLLLAICQIVSADRNNLLLNSNFDLGENVWAPVGAGFATQDHSSGTKALYLNPTDQKTAGASQFILVGSDVPSIVSVSARSISEAVAGTGEHVLRVEIVDIEGVKTVTQTHFNNPSEWTTAGIKQIVPSVKSVEVSVVLQDKGAVWFDDIIATVEEYGQGRERAARGADSAWSWAWGAPEQPAHPGPPAPPPPAHPAPATAAPTKAPTPAPTKAPTSAPTKAPTPAPTTAPTKASATTGYAVAGTPSATVSSTIAATYAPSSAPTPAPTITTPTYNLGLKYVIFSYSSDDIRLGVVTQALDALGSQYDVVYPANLNNASLALSNADGSGKYLGIIFCTDVVGATDYQLQQIENYQLTYDVKKVVFYTYPYAMYGTTPSASKAASGNAATISFAPASSNFISGYTPNVAFPINTIWTYPADITNATLATPAMYVNYPGDSTKYTVAAFITKDNGARSLQFFLDQATWSAHSVGVGSFWVHWLSNNLYLGVRRIYMNCHLDDLFLPSNNWDTSLEISSEIITYRINATELRDFALYINATNKALPAGSNITISFPFNGQGVEDAGGYTKDPLFLAAKTPELMWTYVFEQHTYTHPELDNLTYAEVYEELWKNIQQTTIKLFGSTSHPRYSNNSMVTPSISGIFNGNALKALWDNGIHHIVGDNSRPELASPFPYHGWYTNVTSNGFAGMHVVPREATYIYYDCSDAEQEEGEYNHLYRNYYNMNSTVKDIVTREGIRVTLLLLAFRHDPYMFHQANLREYWASTGAKTTLLAEWIDAVLAQYTQYYQLPIQGHNHQLLSQLWVNREQRDACGFSGTVSVNTASRQIVSVQGAATGSCDIGITGAIPSAAQSKITMETYGPDTTTWINMRKDSFQFNLKTPISL